MSFEDAVKAYSEDRGSAQRDGKLSKFTVNRIVPEFVTTIKAMEIGEISEPVKNAVWLPYHQTDWSGKTRKL